MKGSVKSQDFKSRFVTGGVLGARVPEFSSQLDHCLIGFGAAIGEKHLAWRANDPDEFTGQFGLRTRKIKVRTVNQLPCLPIQRLDDSRMCVAKSGDGNTGSEVQILFSILIPHVGALSTNQNDVVPSVIRHNKLFEELPSL